MPSRLSQQGANPGVFPGSNPGVFGGPGPSAQSNPTQYPPNQAGNTPTSILPHWVARAVEIAKAVVRPKVSPTPRNARIAPNQGFGANAVNLPAGQALPVGASPSQYTRFLAGVQSPGMGASSMNVMYSTPRASMDDQPAFEINPPTGQGRVITNLFDGLNGFNPMRSGLPTFFPVGNRSLQSTVGTGVDSHPTGVTYLVVPPDRYRRPNRAQPVRGKQGQSGGHISRRGTLPMYFGS